MDVGLVLPDRYWAKVDKGIAAPCWQWTASVESKGYGHINSYGGLPSRQAHRLAYMALRGPIPVGFQLDHVCRNKRCVNPDHLEIVTNRENRLRARRLITHCPSGHALVGANVSLDPTRWGGLFRRCITCRRAQIRKYSRRVNGYYLRHPDENPDA